MYCRNCGHEIPDDVRFCPDCGSAVSQADERGQNSGSGNTFDGWDGRWDAENPDYQDSGYNDRPYPNGGYEQEPHRDDYSYGSPDVPAGAKSRVAAGVLAILLGTLGIHKFYLGYTKQGVITLLISILIPFVGAGIMEIISIVEGIIYLTKSDWEFYDTYERHRQPWF